MTLAQLQTESIKALKEGNKEKKNVINDIITNAKYMAIEQKKKDNITEDIVKAAILKTKKVCQEQIDTCPPEREDLLKIYNDRMSYINEYAPVMLTEKQILGYIYMALDSGAAEQTKPSLMRYLMPILKEKADGKLVNKVVTNFLE